MSKTTYSAMAISLLLNLYFGTKVISSKIKTSPSLNTVTVSRVIDGDTFLTTDNKYVRLLGLDSPEFPQNCLSTEAKDKLENLINKEQVSLADISTDHFGRTLAYVFLKDISIDEVLLRDGLGKLIAKNKDYLPILTKAENEAKTFKKGIWGPLCNPDENCQIKGNYRQADNTKVYSLPDCYNYSKTEVDLNKGDHWFCTEKEALAAGFKKSKDCPGMK